MVAPVPVPSGAAFPPRIPRAMLVRSPTAAIHGRLFRRQPPLDSGNGGRRWSPYLAASSAPAPTQCWQRRPASAAALVCPLPTMPLSMLEGAAAAVGRDMGV